MSQITTSQAHGLIPGDIITVSGVKPRPWWKFWQKGYNGAFYVTAVDEIRVELASIPRWWQRLVWWP